MPDPQKDVMSGGQQSELLAKTLPRLKDQFQQLIQQCDRVQVTGNTVNISPSDWSSINQLVHALSIQVDQAFTAYSPSQTSGRK